jgi:hypothetical protein
MQSDFLDAHQRHWDDAETLFGLERLANADHLYGMAAECGLKSLMMVFGMSVDQPTGTPTAKADRVHANAVWVRYETYRAGSSQGAGYSLSATNPFQTWDVSDRYARQSDFDPQLVLEHAIGAEEVSKLIKRARQQGMI